MSVVTLAVYLGFRIVLKVFDILICKLVSMPPESTDAGGRGRKGEGSGSRWKTMCSREILKMNAFFPLQTNSTTGIYSKTAASASIATSLSVVRNYEP